MTAGWDEFVAAATIGTDARPIALTALPGPAAEHAAVISSDDPAAGLLEAAALMSSAARAGQQLPVAPAGRDAAARDSAPVLRCTAADIISAVLADSADNSALLEQLLGQAAHAGYRANPHLLPALLDTAARDTSLRPAVAAVLGERGRWLAAHRADWSRVGQVAPPSSEPAEIPESAGTESVWETGTQAERRAYFTALRRRDPAQARDLLEAAWPKEKGDDREAFVRSLRHQLSADDEPLLERALDDRKGDVRKAAAALLARIPTSAWRRRATERATRLLRVERKALRQKLIVTLPDKWDDAMTRDGLEPSPPAGYQVGERTWWLIQTIAATPLAVWTTTLSMSPREITALPVDGDFEQDVRIGWRTAAIRQRDSEWARALFAVRSKPLPDYAVWLSAHDAPLAAVLPPVERFTRLTELLGKDELGHDPAAVDMQGLPAPWPDAFANAVLRWFTMRSVAKGEPVAAWQTCRLAGLHLPTGGGTDWAAELDRIADTVAHENPWTRALHRTASTVRIRRQFLEELT